MPIDFTCGCGKKLRLKDEFSGKKFRCPACNAVNQAPAVAPAAAPAPAKAPAPTVAPAPAAAPAPANDWFSEEMQNAPPLNSAPVIPASTSPASPTSRSSLKKFLSKRPGEDWMTFLIQRVMLIGGILLLVGSPVAAIYAYNLYSKAKASENWPSVECTITQSSVEQKIGRRHRISYNAKIEYSFAVQGKEYQGSRVSFLVKTGSSEEDAQGVVNKYPASSKQKVFYDPDDPSSCVLETGANTGGGLLLAAIPLVMIAVGFHLVRSWRKQ